LKRTTNVEAIFPGKINNHPSNFTIAEIRQLDAGSWFVDDDPYRTISKKFVSQAEAESYRGEKIPLLAEVLNLTREYDLYLDIDAKYLPEDHPFKAEFWNLLLTQLADSGLDEKIMINSDSILTVNMTQVGTGRDIINIHHGLSNRGFNELEEDGIVVMVWTVDTTQRFSQLWCLGVDFVKTNALHLLVPLESPKWLLNYKPYVQFWAGWVLTVLYFAGFQTYQKFKREKLP
jgi:glycerophosphoryl diester phosphodiesterase